MIASRRPAPLPLLLIGLAVIAALALIPWIVHAQSRDSGSDFTLDAANDYPTGIWSDGTTMWVADFEDHKLYAYRMSDRTRDSDRDFTLDAANGSPVGIWSDGTTMWASDFTDGKLYAYRMSDRSRDSGKDFNTLSAAGNKFPEGIWSDGTTMWVADTGNDTVFAYDLSTRAWDFEKDITLAPGHDSPMGVWSNGSTMWVSDWRDSKLYAYRMSDQSWDAGKDFALDADDESYEGIWSAGSTMWVASRDDDRLYAYDWNNPATGAPTITGAVRVDETLAAGTRSIADADGLDAASFEYQWVSSDGNADTDIAGATDSTYTIVPGDRGKAVKVRVSFTDGAGNSESLTSEPTGQVGAPGICDRTPAVMSAIVAGMIGVADCSEASETRLRTWTGSRHFGPDVTPGLYLQGRGLSALQAGDFGDLHALRALDLNRNFLETVPDGLFEDLRAVEELYLSGNLLSELPDGLFDGQGEELSVLDLSANRLELMPEGVLRNLAGLVSLSLSGNGLSDLPAGLFDDLARLEVLDLSANSLNELPDGVFDGSLELRDVDVSINEISELPEGVFGGLGDLQSLSLAGNDLKSLTEDVFADLGSLAELDLSGNKLKDLPVGVFEGLSGLTDLDAGDNPGAPFTFTAELERRGDDTVVVRIDEGATPFDLKVELSARNGDLSAGTVTIESGSSYSDVIDVRPHGQHPVTIEIDSAAFLLPSGGSASGISAGRGSDMHLWIGRPLVQREWIQDGPFALHPENADPKSIWSDGETLWVGDSSARKVFAYKLWDNPDTVVSEYGTRDPGWDVPSLGQEDFYVTGHGPQLYVAEESLDGASRDVFGYDLTSFTRAKDRDFVYGGLNVAGGVFIVRGTATDGRHMWITNTTSHAHAFRLFDDPETPKDEYGKPDTSRKLTIPGSGQLRGLFTDGRTMWGVRFASNDSVVRSVKLSDGTDAGYDFTLHEDNDHAYGIWSNGETFYVVDVDDDMIYTYHGISGVVRPSVEDAETAAALLGNTGQSGDAGHDLGSAGAKRAQAFTTGTSKAGYALASVGIEFGEVSDTSSAPSDLEVTLNADGGGVPGDALCTLIAPASLSERSVNTFAAPASGTTCPVLEKETTYFVVVERVRVTGSSTITVSGTASGSEDTGAAEGWSIADGSATYSPQAAAQGWASDAFSYKIEVRGSFINNPAAGEATVTGTAQVKRTLAAAVSDVSDDDGLTGATYSYQWMRIDGATETNIGTGSPTYTLVAEDLGKRIKVRVSFVDDRGNYETLTSEATAAVEVFKAEDRPGTVSLFPARPRVGTVLSAALSDPDGLEGGSSGPAASSGAVSWSWARSSDGTTWTRIEAYGDGDSYVPTEEDEEMLLKAEASYTDGHGPGKSAEAVSAAVVGPRESGPELTVTEIVKGLSHPWGIDFTPDGTMLFTQRAGVLNARLTDGTVKRVAADLGDLLVDGFAGLQALAVDPDFTTNRRFYTLQGHAGREMQVIAWTIDANYDEATRVVDPLVKGIPMGPGPWHSGGRLLFGPEGYLWIATGDGRVVTGAQDLTSLGGKVLRVDPRTGAGAPGNPFGASSPVYSYGFRNPQGLALRPGTDQMWLVEHGPKHDDEINLLAPGGNYGWDPIPDDGTLVFYDYSDEAGVPMTDLAKFPSARQARWSSGFPTLATSGAVFLDGPQWGEWEGRLAVATLKTKSLRVFEFTEQGDFASQIVVPELDGSQGRLRTPVIGPDGALYIATSNRPGNDRILRVTANRAATGAPSITGTPRVGETLTADASSVADADGLTNVAFSYRWMRLDGATETNIGTGSSSYTLVAEDSGKTIKVRVAFTDDAGNEEDLTSHATEAVAPTVPGAPKSLKVSVRGTGTLDVSWEAPDSDGGSAVTGYRVQWKEAADGWTASEDVSEEAATGTVHTIAGLRDGVEHTVRVIAVNDAGPGPASGAVSGTPGNMLWSATLTVGTAKDFAGYSSFAQGEENNTLGAISSDTITLDDASYTVKALGVLNGKLILSVMPQLTADFVLVVGTDEFASTDASTLEGDSIIQFQWNDRGLDLPEGEEVAVRATEPAENTPATGEPTISGTPQVGETLTADTSGIADTDGLNNVSYSYQWLADDANIDGATGSTYILANSDEGKAIKVRVRFTDDADNSETLTSAATAAVAAKPNSLATGAPTISGTPQVGETLTADTSGIADTDGLNNVSYSYQWLADDANIDGATGSTYILANSDEGKAIKVRVRFTDDADNSETLTSAATAAVAAKPNSLATGAPTISGTVQVGETLTADTSGIADADGLTNVSYSYQWIRSDGDTDTDTEIGGETDSTYTVADDDVGKHVKVRVAFIDDAGNEESLTSGTTEVLVDYDADDDGLIEVTTLKQLDAIRHDLDGDGIPTDDGVAAYTAAFPDPVERMGCSGADGCAGYEIMADLDFDTNGSGADDAGDTYWNDGAGWTPIGGGASEISTTRRTMHNPFLAIFEGNGRTISNLFVDKRGNFLGLFGYVGFDAASGAVGIIRNVNLIDVNVTGGHYGSGLAAVNLGVITNSQVTGLVTGVDIVGGLVGENYGVIADSHVAGCVSGGQMVGGLVGRSYGAITNSSVTGCVSALSYVGGLVGNNYGLITGSHTAGRVSGHGVIIGGLVGSHKGTITASHSTARVLGTDSGPQSTIIGGLVGDNRGAIGASYATGHVSGEGWVGGLVGQNASATESPSTITASYATGRVSGTRKIGGLVGVNYGTITASYAAGPVSGSEDVGGLAGTSGGAITASYWDTRTSGHPAGSHGVGKTTAELQAPTGYSGIYETWNLNGDDVPDSPWGLGSATQHLALAAGLEMDTDDILDSLWDLGSASQYPALAADLDGAGRATWQEFGHQLRAGPALTTTVTLGEDSVELSWTAVDTSHWSPVPTVTYTLYRGDGDAVEAIVRDLEGLIHTDDDVTSGETYSYQVVAVVAGGEAAHSALHSATPSVNAPATGAATIGGTAQVDETLTVDTSAIADEDGLTNVSYNYQWIRSDGGTDTDIVGETDSTYTLVSADQGKIIKVKVTFTDDADNKELLTSAATATVVAKPNTAPTGLPTISGTARVDETLAADTSDIADDDGLTNVSYTYQWISNDGNTDTDIAGQTDSTYTLVAADAGKTIKVKVSFTDDANNSETLTSDATATVAARLNSPPTGLPSIGGTPQVDQTLTADTSGIADEDGLTNVSYTYQWISNDGNTDTDIQDATDSTYTLTDDDAGKAIKVKVSFTDDANNEETLTSAPTAAVAAKPNSLPTGLPSISGTAQVGETLTTDVSGIADADGLDADAFGYQWVSNDGNADTDIAGATASTYTLVSDDVGKTIKVKVSFTDDANNQESLTSAVTAAVVAKPNSPPTGLPVITGEAQVDETLTAVTSGISDADGLTSVSYSYQWIRSDGGTDTDIEGETTSTYTLSNSDIGKTFRVRVSFTDDAGHGESLIGAPTASVTPASRSVIYEYTPTAHPTSLVAEWKGGSVRLTWYAPRVDKDSISGYSIYRNSEHVVDRLGSGTMYRDGDATDAGSEYTYCVKAKREGGNYSECSNEASITIPGATDSASSGPISEEVNRHPTDLTVSLVNGEVLLRWEAPVEDAEAITGYEILRRRPSEGEHTLVAYGQAIGGTTFTDVGANDAGVKYTYRVKALRGEERSRWSNYANITLAE